MAFNVVAVTYAEPAVHMAEEVVSFFQTVVLQSFRMAEIRAGAKEKSMTVTMISKTGNLVAVQISNAKRYMKVTVVRKCKHGDKSSFMSADSTHTMRSGSSKLTHRHSVTHDTSGQVTVTQELEATRVEVYNIPYNFMQEMAAAASAVLTEPGPFGLTIQEN